MNPAAWTAHASVDVRAAVTRTLVGCPPDTLLHRASVGLAVACGNELRARRGRVTGSRVVLLVGTGNNGADALLAGARLRNRGARVDAVLVGDRVYEPGVSALRRAGGRVLDACEPSGYERAAAALSDADLVLDGVVGEACNGPLTEPARSLVAAISANTFVVAVDLPSGVDPDTGEVFEAHVCADLTVTFGTYKACLLVPPASRLAGRVEFVDVGIDTELPDKSLVQRLTLTGIARRWPVPDPSSHKYSRGVLGVVAGSDAYPGAAVLTVLGAYRVGTGIVRFVGPRRVTDHVLNETPEAVPGVGTVNAWLLGSGVEDDPEQDRVIDEALSSGLPCVVDAGALQACVQQRAAGARAASADRMLLTPHVGELTRMLAWLGHSVTSTDVLARPLHHARWAARESETTVLLKGYTTLIVNPDGDVLSQADAPAWSATAGSGDVLAGIAGALMAGGLDAMDAGAISASVHGLAAARASADGPISASRIAEATPATVRELLTLR